MQNSGNVYIKTFGCVQNSADSERVKAYYWDKGYKETDNWKESDIVVINTCIIRESAENRAYGLINSVNKFNKANRKNIKIVVTGCLSGLAYQDKTGKKLKKLQTDFPTVSEFLPIEQISYEVEPLRNAKNAALIPISSGCSNFCSYCIVPYARGPEVSRDFAEILVEIDKVIQKGFKNIVLIGQNVNSYGSDLVKEGKYELPDGRKVDPIMVKSMGKSRIPTLFPYLLEEVAKKGVEKISFVSSNPWDFSDELIEVIANNPNIDRLLHLPIQCGDTEILKKMNRGYTAEDYLALVKKIRNKIPNVRFSTDIIIGFPGEDEASFQKSVEVFKEANFEIAYLNKYSPRRGTVSAKIYENNIPQSEKRKRWKILSDLINKKV
jgi:tRNA-2-methylthio-N6-dimethylallyladenosine synthase